MQRACRADAGAAEEELRERVHQDGDRDAERLGRSDGAGKERIEHDDVRRLDSERVGEVGGVAAIGQHPRERQDAGKGRGGVHGMPSRGVPVRGCCKALPGEPGELALVGEEADPVAGCGQLVADRQCRGDVAAAVEGEEDDAGHAIS
ncbi:hypothetical protein [Naasia aerilata]|uniref:hypothetical protein n=1 Tax=Naasia aerilata TaxID=1162966 RepID=UPI002572B73A|nr:hypothetical protein [Naasia aerilata]